MNYINIHVLMHQLEKFQFQFPNKGCNIIQIIFFAKEICNFSSSIKLNIHFLSYPETNN